MTFFAKKYLIYSILIFFCTTVHSFANTKNLYRTPSLQCYNHNNPTQPFTTCSPHIIEEDLLQKGIKQYHLNEVIQKEFVYNTCRGYCNGAKACNECTSLEDCLQSYYCYQCHLDPFHTSNLFDFSLDPRCTYRALQNVFQSQYMFLDCRSLYDENPITRRDPPCLSQQIHYAVHQAITEIASCFQLNPKAIFALTVKESSSHPLIINPSPDSTVIGIAQITNSFLNTYNNHSVGINYDTYKYSILDLLPQCQKVRSKLELLSQMEHTQGICTQEDGLKNCQGKNFCQRTSPYLSIFYTVMNMIAVIDQLVPQILNHRLQTNRNILLPEASPFYFALTFLEGDSQRALENLLIFQSMFQDDQNIITELMLYSHFLPYTTKQLFQKYLDELDENPIPSFTDFTGAKGQWITFLNENKQEISEDTDVQDAYIRYIYNDQNEELSLLAILQRIENRNGENQQPIPSKCSPY